MKNFIWGILFSCFVLDVIKINFFDKNDERNTKLDLTEVLKANDNEMLNEKINLEKSKYEANSSNIGSKHDEISDKVFVRIQYCSNTYSKQFEEMRKELIGSYSNIEVIGSEFQINFIKKSLSKIVWFLQMFMIIIFIGGQAIRNYLTFIPVQVFKFIDDNKFIMGILNFLVMGWLSRQLSSSNAFEVFYEGEKIWSKIDSNTLPSALKISEILSSKGVLLE